MGTARPPQKVLVLSWRGSDLSAGFGSLPWQFGDIGRHHSGVAVLPPKHTHTPPAAQNPAPRQDRSQLQQLLVSAQPGSLSRSQTDRKGGRTPRHTSLPRCCGSSHGVLGKAGGPPHPGVAHFHSQALSQSVTEAALEEKQIKSYALLTETETETDMGRAPSLSTGHAGG